MADPVRELRRERAESGDRLLQGRHDRPRAGPDDDGEIRRPVPQSSRAIAHGRDVRVLATNVALPSATIGWQTNNPANSRVDYGTTTGYGSFATSATLVNTHSVALSGLAPRTIYHYQVTSVDAFAQSVTSADATFTTASSTFDLFVSAAANRSAPSPLQGQTVAGTIYVFTSPASGVTRVR